MARAGAVAKGFGTGSRTSRWVCQSLSSVRCRDEMGKGLLPSLILLPAELGGRVDHAGRQHIGPVDQHVRQWLPQPVKAVGARRCHEGGDLYGDGVDFGARLREIAEPSDICVSRRIHDDVRRLESSPADARLFSPSQPIRCPNERRHSIPDRKQGLIATFTDVFLLRPHPRRR
jgi:hypothetical protein